MEHKNYSGSLDPVERESFLEKLNDCNDIEYLKQVNQRLLKRKKTVRSNG